MDGSIVLKFGAEFHHVTDDTLQLFKVMAAMDRLSDSKLGMGVVVKADKDWRGVGRTQVVMHSQLPRFLVYFFVYRSFAVSRHEEAAPQMYTGRLVGREA